MGALDDRRLLEKLYLPPADDFVMVEVPDLQYVVIDGEGGPDNEDFADAMRGLFAVIYRSSRSPRKGWGRASSSRPSKPCGGPTI